jgi:PD-(D/E)XK nuclease superfamily
LPTNWRQLYEETSSREGGGAQSDERASLEAAVEKVVGAVCEVSNILGAGFLEKIYERALMEELTIRGARIRAEVPYHVACKGKPYPGRIRPIWRSKIAYW